MALVMCRDELWPCQEMDGLQVCASSPGRLQMGWGFQIHRRPTGSELTLGFAHSIDESLPPPKKKAKGPHVSLSRVKQLVLIKSSVIFFITLLTEQ